MMNIHERMLGILLSMILFGEIVLVIQPTMIKKTTVNVLSVKFDSETEVKVTYTIKQGTYPNKLTVSLLPVYQSLHDKDLYVYYDRDYPSSFVFKSSWVGIIDHLEENIKLKDYKGKMEIVNASTLKEIMLTKYNSIIIIPSGVLPETVHTKESSLVKQYLDNGGIVIWIGDVFAALIGKFRNSTEYVPSDNNATEFQEKILGYLVSNRSKLEVANIRTNYSEALSLKYSGVQAGIFSEELLKHDGIVLGWTREGRASIGVVPVGKGYLILFGGKVTPARTQLGEDFVAADIINILLSGAIYSKGKLSYKVVLRKDAYNETLSLTLNNPEIVGVMLIVVSDDFYSYYFFRQFIPKP